MEELGTLESRIFWREVRDVTPLKAAPDAIVWKISSPPTEGPAIVQLIADKVGGGKLAPEAGSPERYRLQEWLNFNSTDLHKSFGPLFSPVLGDDAKQFFKDRIARYLAYADKQLAGKDYLMGSQFTVADGYLFVILSWAERMKIDTSAFPNLNAFKARVAARPKVQAALQNAHAGAGAGVPWGLAVSIASRPCAMGRISG